MRSHHVVGVRFPSEAAAKKARRQISRLAHLSSVREDRTVVSHEVLTAILAKAIEQEEAASRSTGT